MQIAVVAHVYYPDLWPEIAAYLRKWPSKDFVLYVTTAEDRIDRIKSTIGDEFDAVFILHRIAARTSVNFWIVCRPFVRYHLQGPHQEICMGVWRGRGGKNCTGAHWASRQNLFWRRSSASLSKHLGSPRVIFCRTGCGGNVTSSWSSGSPARFGRRTIS